MEVRTLPLGLYQTNCYVVWEETADTCVVIDPGYATGELETLLAKENKKVEAVLLTHCHFDHVGGVASLARQENCPVYICPSDLDLPPMMTDGEIYYTDTYEEGDVLHLAGLTFRVLHTPGHTPGSVCLQCEDALFTGDTLFAGSCGRTDFPGSSPRDMVSSLKRLAALPGDFRVLPGHGVETTLNEERRSNPFMVGL